MIGPSQMVSVKTELDSTVSHAEESHGKDLGASGPTVNGSHAILPLNGPNTSQQSQLIHFPEASHEWNEEELKILEEGVARFSLESLPPVMKYVKIASMIEGKTARDVALRCKWTQKKESGKRKKTEESAPSKKSKDKKIGLLRMVQGQEMKGSFLPSTSRQGTLPPYPQLQTGISDNMMNGTEEISSAPSELLSKNAVLFKQIKSNVAAQKPQENNDLFVRLRDNILCALNGMTNMPGIMSQMPPLPVKLNIELANQILLKPMGPPPLPMHHM